MSEDLYSEYLEFLSDYGLRPPRRPAITTGHFFTEIAKQTVAMRNQLLEFGDSILVNPCQKGLTLISQVLLDRGAALPQDVLFGEFPTNRYNALCYKAKRGFFCLLSRGLLGMVEDVAHCVAFSAEEGENDSFEFPTIDQLSHKDRLRTAITSVLSLIVAHLKEREPQYDRIPVFGLSDWRRDLAKHISLSIESFVVAHELGHISLGHLGHCETHNVVTPAGIVLSVRHRYAEEYEADVFAQDILMERDNDSDLVWMFAIGGPFFLMVHMVIGVVESKLRGAVWDEALPSEDHPPSSVRAQALMSDHMNRLDPRRLGICAGLQRGLSSLYILLSNSTLVDIATESRVRADLQGGISLFAEY